jgi:hypothetical protein
MTFIARLIEHSAIWKMWRQGHRAGGEISGVLFKSVAVGRYETDTLTADQASRLREIPSVRLVMFGETPVANTALTEAPLPPVHTTDATGRTDGMTRQPAVLSEGRLTLGRVADTVTRNQPHQHGKRR